MRAICQICAEEFALVDVDDFVETSGETGKQRTVKALRYPVNGDMFGCLDAFHNFIRPIDATLTWEFFRHYGTHRHMVQDDAVLTHKGLVRLPRDGSPAYLDKEASIEVDRHSVGDRVLQVPDDVAEKMAREALADPDKSIWICAICNKSFETKRKLQGHLGGAHKKRPEPSPKKAPAKKKGRKR